MKFHALHIAAFRAASHDLNPLHLDAGYARRTQFGKPVVYGMAAVLYGLGVWAHGRSFRLQQLRSLFRKPLYEGEEYALQIEEQDGEVSLKFRKGTVDYAVVTFTHEWLEKPVTELSQLYHPFQPQTIAAAEPATGASHVHYRMNIAAWPQLQDHFHIAPNSMPLHQLATLLWASYHVGMVMPGRQALFSELQVAFMDGDWDSAGIEVELAETDMDERFHRYVVEGKGSGIAQVRIAAFKRPLPVDFSLGHMPRFADEALPLQGKVVFISGATRGFGAAMARMCALAGASLALNYRSDVEVAQALCKELQDTGTVAEAFPADMGDPDAVTAMTAAVTSRFGCLDWIVNNAAPPIRDLQFEEQDNAHFQKFVQQNLAITLETARHLLPLLSTGGQFLHVSTKYLVEPVRGFAHYLAAKASQEALVQALSLEFRDIRFTVARLPRILTDQTNLAFDFDPPLHPGAVARDAILAAANSAEMGNFKVVNLFEE